MIYSIYEAKYITVSPSKYDAFMWKKQINAVKMFFFFFLVTTIYVVYSGSPTIYIYIYCIYNNNYTLF